MSYKAFEEKKRFIFGKNVVSLDPAKANHQLAVVNHYGISLHNPFTIHTDH